MQKCLRCSTDEGWTCPYLEVLVLGFKCHSLKVSATSFLGVQCLPDRMPVEHSGTPEARHSPDAHEWSLLHMGLHVTGITAPWGSWFSRLHGFLGYLTACTTGCIGE